MNERLLSYNNLRKSYTTREYLLDLIAFHVCPVLLAAKPSALIGLTNIIKKNLVEVWDQEKAKLFYKKKICYEELKRKRDSVSILFYHPEDLQAVLNVSAHSRFLKRYGYPVEEDLVAIFKTLKKRFNSVFPHEVGIFLGIPLADVLCFIHCPENKPLQTGYWKVYTDPENARLTFAGYNAVKRNYINFILEGNKAEDYLRIIIQ